MTQANLTLIKDSIATVPNYPKEGIMFRDVTTLLADPKAFKETIDAFIAVYKDQGFT
ncbi:MAG: adenine phosphoribosyltransferase, partial [Pseudomonadota bacterium]